MKNKKSLDDMKKRGSELMEEIDRMFTLMGNQPTVDNNLVSETSISRLWRFSQEHDVAIITAFRKKYENCLKYTDYEDRVFTKEENKLRNKDLLSVLLHKGYGVTEVDGNYYENFETPSSREVSEDSYFVVNWNDDDDFNDTIIRLGKFFCQDSVLLKPKGEDAYLYGTNNAEFPGLDNKVNQGKFRGGHTGEFLTRVGKTNRPLIFKEYHNNSGKYLISISARKVMSEW